MGREVPPSDYFKGSDPFLKELYFLYTDRDIYDGNFYKFARYAFGMLWGLDGSKQLAVLNTIFDSFPSPDTRSLKDLKSSLFDIRVFPRRFVRGLGMNSDIREKFVEKQIVLLIMKKLKPLLISLLNMRLLMKEVLG
jgi:hypothetical protein